MARRYANPYLDPSFAAIGSNLVKAFANDGKGAYYAAHTRKTNLEADAQERKNKGAQGVADLFRTMTANPSAALTTLYAVGADAGYTPQQINQMALGALSNFGGTDSAVGRALVGTGQAIGKDQAVSLPDREKVAGRENSAALQRTATSAGIAAGASRANNADNIKQRESEFRRTGQSDVGKVFADTDNLPMNDDRRRLLGDAATRKAQGSDRPIVLAPGASAYDPRTGQQMANNPRPDRDPTPQTVMGGILSKRARGETLTPAEQQAYDMAHRQPAAPLPLHVTPQEIGMIELDVLNEIGAWDGAGKRPHAEFVTEYGPKMELARQAAGATLQRTRDAAQAAAAYRAALGMPAGTTYGRTDWLGLGSRKVVPPTGAVPSPSPPAAAPPAGAPPAVQPAPAPQARQPGQVYQTPRGPMKWTGTGWVAP